MPDPSMAESPLDFGEGINECAMFSAALDSAVLAESGHSSCDEQSSDAARDAVRAAESRFTATGIASRATGIASRDQVQHRAPERSAARRVSYGPASVSWFASNFT